MIQHKEKEQAPRRQWEEILISADNWKSLPPSSSPASTSGLLRLFSERSPRDWLSPLSISSEEALQGFLLRTSSAVLTGIWANSSLSACYTGSCTQRPPLVASVCLAILETPPFHAGWGWINRKTRGLVEHLSGVAIPESEGHLLLMRIVQSTPLRAHNSTSPPYLQRTESSLGSELKLCKFYLMPPQH